MSEPQWLRLGREAAARALYEAWHPLRTDNGHHSGSVPWEELPAVRRAEYEAAGEAACRAFNDSMLASSRSAIRALRAAAVGEENHDG